MSEKTPVPTPDGNFQSNSTSPDVNSEDVTSTKSAGNGNQEEKQENPKSDFSVSYEKKSPKTSDSRQGKTTHSKTETNSLSRTTSDAKTADSKATDTKATDTKAAAKATVSKVTETETVGTKPARLFSAAGLFILLAASAITVWIWRRKMKG